MNRRPKFFAVLKTISSVTFREIVLDKVLYSSILCAVLLLATGYLASKLTIVRNERIILDFGFSAVNLACTFIGILIGAPIIGREFQRRTAFVSLSKPISRLQFVLGQYSGLSLVLLVNWVLLCGVFLAIYLLSGGETSSTMLWGLLLLLFQSLMMGALVMTFSCYSTTSLSVIIAIGIYLIGNNISQIRFLAAKTQNEFGQFLLNSFSQIFPNLEYFNLGFRITYHLPIPLSVGLGSIFYALVWIALSLIVAGILVEKKEL